jgi:hypothetical protein
MIVDDDADKPSITQRFAEGPLRIRSLRHMAIKTILSAVAIVSTVAATDASAQGVNLTGQWQCVALCLGPPGGVAFITQNGWQLNIVSDAGVPSRAWVDYPGRIWIETAYQGAIYSPDGFTLQFDRGSIWQRLQVVPLPAPPLRR